MTAPKVITLSPCFDEQRVVSNLIPVKSITILNIFLYFINFFLIICLYIDYNYEVIPPSIPDMTHTISDRITSDTAPGP